MAITLLDMLLNAKMVSPAQIDDALQNRVFFGGKIGTSLVELGFLREEDLARFLGRKLMVPYISPDELLHIPAATIALIPKEMALKYRVIPLEMKQKRLSLVMSDPADLAAVDEISFITGFVIKPMIAPEFRLLQALSLYYGLHISTRFQRIIDRLHTETVAASWIEPENEPATASEDPPAGMMAASGEVEAVVDLEDVEVEEVLRPVDAAAAGLAPVADTESAEGAWAEKVQHYAIGEISRRLAYVEDREEIAAALLESLSQEFRRAALFIVRGDNASGWRAAQGGVEVADFEKVHIPFARPSVLKTVAEGKSFYLGPLTTSSLDQRILAALGSGKASESALVMPVVVLGRVVDILYLEGKDGDLADSLPAVQRLLNKAALAFEILICRDKILLG
jgi:hypothetical protein